MSAPACSLLYSSSVTSSDIPTNNWGVELPRKHPWGWVDTQDGLSLGQGGGGGGEGTPRGGEGCARKRVHYCLTSSLGPARALRGCPLLHDPGTSWPGCDSGQGEIPHSGHSLGSCRQMSLLLLPIHSLYQHKPQELRFRLPLMMTDPPEPPPKLIPRREEAARFPKRCPLPAGTQPSATRGCALGQVMPCTVLGLWPLCGTHRGTARTAQEPRGAAGGCVKRQLFRCLPSPFGRRGVPIFPTLCPRGCCAVGGCQGGWIQLSLHPTYRPLPYCLQESSSALSHPAPRAGGGNSPRRLRKWLFPAGRRSKAAAGGRNSVTSGWSPSHRGLWGLSRQDEAGDATPFPGASGGVCGHPCFPVQSKPRSTGTKCHLFAESGPDGDPSSAARRPPTQLGLSPFHPHQLPS